MVSLNIIFCGSGEFGLPALRSLVSAGHRVIQVFSQPDRPAGRGGKLTPTPISAFAVQQGLPLVRTADINAELLPPADLMIVIAFGQKISPAATNHARLGSVNLHASLLPKYRGAAPINWAIMRGESTSGNSVIRLAERMDAGAILGQSHLAVGPTETAGELHDRLAEDGALLMLKVTEELSTGTAIEQPQDESQATLAPKLNRELSLLNFRWPARQVADQIRGMYPWPGCRAQLWHGESAITRLTLIRAVAHSDNIDKSPGRIMADGRIAVGDGSLEVIELQPEGRRAMSLAAFRNGHPWQDGMRLEPII